MENVKGAAMFKTGNWIEITTKARPYSHMGYTDPSCIIPETVEVMRVCRVIRSKKNGLIVWFKREDGTGYGINNAETTTTHTFRKVEK